MLKHIRSLPITPLQLGESVRWYDEIQRLIFVDIIAMQVGIYDPGRERTIIHPVAERVGGVYLAKSGRLIITLTDSVKWMDIDSGRTESIARISSGDNNFRTNDGRCDPAGQLWFTTMANQPTPPPASGVLYRLSGRGVLEPKLRGFSIPNAIAFSPDGSTMYFADTPLRTVWSCTLDVNTGEIGSPRIFIQWDNDVVGNPDGCCIDEEGGFWIALTREGARVERYLPCGKLDRTIHVPARRPTMCALGGPERSTLFVTSMDANVDKSTNYCWRDGHIFAIEVGVRGLAENLVDDSYFAPW